MGLTTLRQFIRGVRALPKFAEAHDLERQVTDADKLGLELSSKLMAARNRIADLERQIETLRGALGQRVDEAEATALRNELAAERAKTSDLERQLADVVKSHDMWHAQWREVQQQLTAEREAHTKTTKAHGDMTAAFDSACSDRDSLRAQLDTETREAARRRWARGWLDHERGMRLENNPYAGDLAVNEEEPSCDCDRDPACARCSDSRMQESLEELRAEEKEQGDG